MTWLADNYLWLKAFHIISVIAWMAGMLYLPRLYVYHAGVEPKSAASETFKVMERRLARAIMLPAMIATLIFGLLLAAIPGVAAGGWFHAKLLLVAGLLACHGFLARWRREFAEDRNSRSAGFYRMVNEIPTVLMILIVILVVVKPF